MRGWIWGVSARTGGLTRLRTRSQGRSPEDRMACGRRHRRASEAGGIDCAAQAKLQRYSEPSPLRHDGEASGGSNRIAAADQF